MLPGEGRKLPLMKYFLLLLTITLTLTNCCDQSDAPPISSEPNLKSISESALYSKNPKSRIMLVEDYLRLSIDQGKIHNSSKGKALSVLDTLGRHVCSLPPKQCPGPPCDVNQGPCPTGFLMGSISGFKIESIEILDRKKKLIEAAKITPVDGTTYVYDIKFDKNLAKHTDVIMRFETSKGSFVIDIK